MRQIQRVGSAGLWSVVLEEKERNAPGNFGTSLMEMRKNRKTQNDLLIA